MKKEMKCNKAIFLQLFLLFTTTPVNALTQINGNTTISCTQSRDLQYLSCQYRNNNAKPVLSITAEYDGNLLPIKESNSYPNNDAITAVLFMIDTSDPARQNVINKNIEHINNFLSSSREYHQFGLASFDKELKLEAPIGSDTSVINNSAKGLKANGSTTELYRNMLKAIALFRDIDAERKSIFLFSDGLAEDKAYFHNDVINAANNADIIITSIGYPRSITQSVSLQTLRRLSEETGGIYIEADDQLNILNDFLQQPFTSLDNGGKFNVHLQKIINNKLDNESNIKVIFETDIGTSIALVPIKFNPLVIVQTPAAEIIKRNSVFDGNEEKNNASPTIPIQLVTQSAKVNIFETWLWYVIPVALFILMALTIFTFSMMLRRQNKNTENTVSLPEVKPYAFLISQDETKIIYPIIRTTCRLGRSSNNEITLRDVSVSRCHAEIHLDNGDEFTLIDLNSLNGVFVNHEKIGRYRIKEDDIIEIGDINLRFSLMPIDYWPDESTVIQDTKMLSIH